MTPIFSSIALLTGIATVSAPSYAESCREQNDTIPKLQKMEADLRPIEQCTPLSGGESRLVSMRDKNYVFLRLPDDATDRQPVYQINIPLKFVPHPKQPPNTTDYASLMLERARACFAFANQKMKGPNGEHLMINLISDDAPRSIPRGQVHEIQVFSGTRWVPYNQWSLDYNCPTIVHETFHLLGLADEYPLLQRGYEVGQDGKWLRWVNDEDKSKVDPARYRKTPEYCRPVGPKNSLLYDQYEAYRASGIAMSYEDYVGFRDNECTRRSVEQDAYCRLVAETLEPLARSAREKNKGVLDAVTKKQIAGRFNERAGEESKSIRKSLLFPAQFNALIFPAECDLRSKRYRACQQNSDRTVEQGCSKTVPAECSSNNTSWVQD